MAVINFGRGERGGISPTIVLDVVIFIVAYLSDSFRNEDDNLGFIFNNESQFRSRRNNSRRTELLEKWSSSLTNLIRLMHEPRGRRQHCILYRGTGWASNRKLRSGTETLIL